jgi:hypothetical protein
MITTAHITQYSKEEILAVYTSDEKPNMPEQTPGNGHTHIS